MQYLGPVTAPLHEQPHKDKSMEVSKSTDPCPVIAFKFSFESTATPAMFKMFVFITIMWLS